MTANCNVNRLPGWTNSGIQARNPSLSPFFFASRMSPCLCFASAPMDLQNSVITCRITNISSHRSIQIQPTQHHPDHWCVYINYLWVKSNGFASELIETFLPDDVPRNHNNRSEQSFSFINVLHHRLHPHWPGNLDLGRHPPGQSCLVIPHNRTSPGSMEGRTEWSCHGWWWRRWWIGFAALVR